MTGVDSNVLIRYVVQDDARQSARASRFLEQELTPGAPGFVSVVALAKRAGSSRTATFDRRAARHPGFELLD